MRVHAGHNFSIARVGQKGSVMSSVNASLHQLRELAPRLNKAADDAARIVLDVERLLTNELGIGVIASTTIIANDLTPKKMLFKSLAYIRVHGKFRIAVAEEVVTDFLDENSQPRRTSEVKSVTPWAELSREEKLESFPFLPALLEELIKNAEEARGKVEATQATLTQILEAGPPIAGEKSNADEAPPIQRRKPLRSPQAGLNGLS